MKITILAANNCVETNVALAMPVSIHDDVSAMADGKLPVSGDKSDTLKKYMSATERLDGNGGTASEKRMSEKVA